MITPAQEADLLQKLLGKRRPESFSAAQLSGKAHWRWNRSQLLEAAVLFDAAARRSAEEVKNARPPRDNSFNYRVRAGVTYRQAGEVERAWPLLEEVLTFDWDAACVPEDSHFTEWACVEMLIVLADKNDRDLFSNLFWRAVGRCEQLGRTFPFIHPKQMVLLDLCERLGLANERAHVEAQQNKQPAMESNS